MFQRHVFTGAPLVAVLEQRTTFDNAMNLVASPKRAGKPATPKKVELCLVPGVHTTYKGQTFCGAWSGLFLSAKQMYSRDTADDDGAIRYLSGLIAKDPVNHPKWEKELHEKLAS